MPSLDDYKGQTPAWCPGCGDFAILNAFKKAVFELGIEPHNFTIVSGIGQAGKFPHYLKCNTFNGLHGRTLPVATGLKLANHKMNVFAVGGDGDVYGEGGNHLLHAIRRNINVKLFVFDNQVYGLTKGQASPTSSEELPVKNVPFGVISDQLNSMALGVAMNASFVARGFAGDIIHLKELIKSAINHKGFSILDILQPCVSFNKINTYEWYQKKVYHIEPEYDPYNKVEAFKKSLEWRDRIPIGIIYKNDRTSYEEKISVIKDIPLYKQPLDAEKIKATLKEFY